jgi:hypothetical protein
LPVDPRPLLLALLLLIPIRTTPLRAIPLRGIPLREIQSVAAIKRPEQPVAVCVVAPRVEAIDQGNARGVVPVSDPQLVVVEPLQELRIERGGQLVWHLEASAGRPIRGPLTWPVAPIAAGESLSLRLRPLNAPVGAFAHVELIGATPDRMQAAAGLISSLGRKPAAWLAAIDAALVANDVPLAWSLLFHAAVPRDPELDGLRQEVVRRGCGD